MTRLKTHAFFLLLAVIIVSGAGCSNQISTKTGKDGQVMVQVPAGEFRMGSSAEQVASLGNQFTLLPDALQSESPQQTLSLSEVFIDQTPVTNAEYKKFLDANPDRAVPYLDLTFVQQWNWDQTARTFPNGRDQYPVVLVTWFDAAAYCKWADARLPTEAEWEKAARGTDGRIWPWGNAWELSRANTVEEKIGDATPVGQFAKGASPYGALDMVGNVWQWTSTLDKPYPYNATDGREDPNAAGLRITRGGAWLFGAAVTRTATRNRFAPDAKSASIGFRCAQ